MLLLVISIIVGYLLYKYVYRPTQYWKEKGIPYLKSAWPIFGNVGPMILKTKPMYYMVREQYDQFPNERYYGMLLFNRPGLVIRDLDLLKQISVKDFDYFTDRMDVIPVEADPLMGGSLFTMHGEQWREMRAILSPAFTSSKMKRMFMFMSECSRDFVKCLLEEAKEEVVEVEMKDMFSRYTNDVIATSSFGIKCNSLRERENPFYKMGRKITNLNSLSVGIKLVIATVCPGLLKLTKIGLLPRDASRFFQNIVLNTIDKRTKENITRFDMIHLLMEARKGNLKHESKTDESTGFATVEESDIGKAASTKTVELTNETIAAQALIFLFAGFETSSAVLSFMALELAINTDVQEKLVEEIDEVARKHGENVPYDVILKMKYLDQVISETLRKWTPCVEGDRLCVKEYVIQPAREWEHPVRIPKDGLIVIPFAGIHYDPKYYPNPEKFDPERFAEENKSSIVPGSYLPFGIGPRNCIGSRFALLEVKILFYHILSKFELTVIKKTCTPIRVSTDFNLSAKGGVWLGLKPRNASTD